MTNSSPEATSATAAHPDALTRILAEGSGPAAWHGPNLREAVADVTSETAIRRPGPGRHNIAEIVLHHAWHVHQVGAKLTGTAPAAFPVDGEDWFQVDGVQGPSWDEVLEILASRQAALAKAVADVARGQTASPLPESERLGLVLGITCHAVYHAGQIQLVKRLLESESAAVYYIGSYDILDPAEFQKYPPVVMSLLPRYGGEVLASDTSAFLVEGKARTMNAIIRFPSKEAVLGLYHDPDYQEAKRIRQRSTSDVSMVVVDSFPPDPSGGS